MTPADVFLNGEQRFYSDQVDRSLVRFSSTREAAVQRRLLRQRHAVLLAPVIAPNALRIQRSPFFQGALPHREWFIPSFDIPRATHEFRPRSLARIPAWATMSVRTLWLGASEAYPYLVKFSYLGTLAGVDRRLTEVECRYALFASDALREHWSNPTLLPLWEDAFIAHGEHRYLVRSDAHLRQNDPVYPLASFVRMALDADPGDDPTALYRLTLEPILTALLQQAVALFRAGVALELHGQNTLVGTVGNAAVWNGRFHYRDFGSVALCQALRKKKRLLSTRERRSTFLLKLTSEGFLNTFFWKNVFSDFPSSVLFPLTRRYPGREQELARLYASYRRLANSLVPRAFRLGC